jgi:D-alanyl-lipoteichoic acid acyltransferase DltB (MBOAT superfamily)
MLFNSYNFLLAFLPVFLVLFFAARGMANRDPGRRDVCKWLIVVASLIFYAPFGVRNLLVLAVSVVVNGALAAVVAGRAGYGIGGDAEDRTNGNSVDGSGVDARKHEGTGKGGRDARWVVAFGVVLNVVALLFFKFSGVFFPVAVSFYTFNQISFIVDMYRGEIEKFSLVDYLAYILFFPKLLQGPLMGYKDFEKSMDEALSNSAGRTVNSNFDSASHSNLDAGNASISVSRGLTGVQSGTVDYELILRALFLLAMGLFKKVILADTFGKAVDFGYENLATLGSLEAVLIAVFYSFQLYFDFSGYCDMAAAVCMAIGFDLPMNFNSPYKALGIIDFWKRWHITLTKFFTKYVYIPLGGNRKGQARLYLNLMIVFLLSGLWHGNGWTFIVWGAMHGVLYVIERALTGSKSGNRAASVVKSSSANGSTVNKANADSDGNGGKAIRMLKTILTFAYVTIAWVFFRADTIKDALTLIARMFTGGHKRLATHLSSCFQLDEIWYVIKVTPISKLSFGWDICLWLFLIVAVVIIFFSQNAITIAQKCKISMKTTLATAILLLWSIISLAGVSTFLYMNF